MIDLPTFTSRAIRALAEQQPELDATIAETTETATASGEGLTKQQLADAINAMALAADRPDRVRASQPKPDLVDAYANLCVAGSDAAKTLDALQQAARRDKALVRGLNGAITNAETLFASIRTKAAEHEWARFGYDLQVDGDRLASSRHLALMARRVMADLDKGVDIRDAAERAVIRALFLIVGYPREVRSNGTGGAFREDAMIQALVAREMLHMIQDSYGNAMPIDVARIGEIPD